VSQQLVDAVFPNEEALGKRLVTMLGDQRYEIIGVVGDIRHQSLGTNVPGDVHADVVDVGPIL
jgi:hypothetical protein